MKMTLSEFVQYYFDVENNWHHTVIYDALESFNYCKDGKIYTNKYTFKRYETGEREVTRKYGSIPKNKHFLFLVPRGHGKSTQISVYYPIYRICQNKNIRILIVSASEDISKSFVRQILNILESNEKLRRDFGPFTPELLRGRKWGEKALMVERGSYEKDPTVTAAGLMQRIVSKRADLIILDDLIDLERARTQESRRKTMEWFNNVLYPILEKDGELVVIGTKWYEGDFYDEIEKEKPFDYKLKLKAVCYFSKDEKEKRKKTGIKESLKKYGFEKIALNLNEIFDRGAIRQYDIKEGALWEKRFSLEELDKRRKLIGDSAFFRQYFNDPISTSENFISKKFVDKAFENGKGYYLPSSYSPMLEVKERIPKGTYITIMGVDLAISQSRKSDYSAISIWGLSENGIRYLFHLEKGKWDMNELKTKIVDLYHSYSCQKVVLESNAFQDLIRQDLSADIDIEGFKTTALSKFDEVIGLSHLRVLFEQGKIIIPNFKKEKILDEFYRDLIFMTQDSHTPDMVVASWLALVKLREYENLLSKNSSYLPPNLLTIQIKKLKNPSRVLYIKKQDRMIFSYNSLFEVFLEGNPDEIYRKIKETDCFCGVYIDKEKRCIAYFFDKKTKELIAKISFTGQILFFADIVGDYLSLFSKKQLCLISKQDAFLFRIKTKYPQIDYYFLHPTDKGTETLKEYVDIPFVLPLAFNFTNNLLYQKETTVFFKDKKLIDEASSIVSVDENEIQTTNKAASHFLTFIIAYYLMKEYNDVNEVEKTKKSKKIKMEKPHYQIFNY